MEFDKINFKESMNQEVLRILKKNMVRIFALKLLTHHYTVEVKTVHFAEG